MHENIHEVIPIADKLCDKRYAIKNGHVVASSNKMLWVGMCMKQPHQYRKLDASDLQYIDCGNMADNRYVMQNI